MMTTLCPHGTLVMTTLCPHGTLVMTTLCPAWRVKKKQTAYRDEYEEI